MRVLAMTASAFSAAVFLACDRLPGGWLLPAGLVLILSGAALALVLRKRPRPRLAALLVWAGVGRDLEAITIGTLMVLVPGMALTNAMREIMAGDIISGLTRTAEVILVATAIALGSALPLVLAQGL